MFAYQQSEKEQQGIASKEGGCSNAYFRPLVGKVLLHDLLCLPNNLIL